MIPTQGGGVGLDAGAAVAARDPLTRQARTGRPCASPRRGRRGRPGRGRCTSARPTAGRSAAAAPRRRSPAGARRRRRGRRCRARARSRRARRAGAPRGRCRAAPARERRSSSARPRSSGSGLEPEGRRVERGRALDVVDVHDRECLAEARQRRPLHRQEEERRRADVGEVDLHRHLRVRRRLRAHAVGELERVLLRERAGDDVAPAPRDRDAERLQPLGQRRRGLAVGRVRDDLPVVLACLRLAGLGVLAAPVRLVELLLGLRQRERGVLPLPAPSRASA